MLGPDRQAEWVEENRQVVDFAFAEFMKSGEWPTVAAARRHFARQRQAIDIAAVAASRPRRPGEVRQLQEEWLRLGIRELQYVPNASPLVEVCLAIARRAAEIYRSLDDSELKVASDDPAVAAVAGGDNMLVLRGGALLLRGEHPSPVGGGNLNDDGWQLVLNEVAVLDFENVASASAFRGGTERHPRS